MPPRKHVSLQRRSADKEAERAAEVDAVFKIPSHPNAYSVLQNMLECDEEDAQEEKAVPESDVSSHNRLVLH